MTRSYLLAAGIALLIAPSALAQVSVIGGGLAKDCYEAARFESVSPHEGEKTCTQALESEMMRLENRAATFTNRGVLRMRSGKYDASLSDYATAKKLQPERGAVWLNEGAAYIFSKDYASALESLDQSIALGTDELFAAYYNRAIAKENLGDLQGAYFDFQKSLELKPDFERAQWQLSRFTVTTN